MTATEVWEIIYGNCQNMTHHEYLDFLRGILQSIQQEIDETENEYRVVDDNKD